LFKQDANAILNEMKQVKSILIMKISQIVATEMSNYHVDVYGSHATGLCLHWSDIDLVVKPNDEKDAYITLQDSTIKENLRRISECLSKEMSFAGSGDEKDKPKTWVTSVKYIDQATVPVVKVECSLSALMDSQGLKYPKNAKYASIYSESFHLDITHMTEFHNGLKCVGLVKEYLLDCWFIEPLILVLK
jgi:non-canonical poly(A) RNA polymerase PAPD5/7